MATKRLVICGGNGFLGSRICKSAVARGWDVTSIRYMLKRFCSTNVLCSLLTLIAHSRSGEPTWTSVTSSASPPSWARKVTWERANILSPATYAPLLKGADYIVHSMGILLEVDYKGVLSGKESPISGLSRAFSSAMGGTQNPLTRNGGGLKKQEEDGQFHYELMNRDSAITLAREADKEKILGFAYISAAAAPPMVSRRYMDTKREAENAIAREFPTMRSIFIRPAHMYDPSRAYTMPIAAASGVGAMVNNASGGIVGGVMGSFMGTAVMKPLKADVVAEAVVEALSDEKRKGAIEIKAIEELAEKGWRKGML
jgi:uncharacterized protein YbjT (DUF2867 family)